MTVVDECDSTMGCDDEHNYQPPCPNNIVDASKAVWEALGIPKGDWGDYDITWSDAQCIIYSTYGICLHMMVVFVLRLCHLVSHVICCCKITV